jgi:hypothetical protein
MDYLKPALNQSFLTLEQVLTAKMLWKNLNYVWFKAQVPAFQHQRLRTKDIFNVNFNFLYFFNCLLFPCNLHNWHFKVWCLLASLSQFWIKCLSKSVWLNVIFLFFICPFFWLHFLSESFCFSSPFLFAVILGIFV